MSRKITMKLAGACALAMMMASGASAHGGAAMGGHMGNAMGSHFAPSSSIARPTPIDTRPTPVGTRPAATDLSTIHQDPPPPPKPPVTATPQPPESSVHFAQPDSPQ